MKLIKKEFVPCPYPLYAVFDGDGMKWRELVIGFNVSTEECETEYEREHHHGDFAISQNPVFMSGDGYIEEGDEYSGEVRSCLQGFTTDTTFIGDIVDEKEGD